VRHLHSMKRLIFIFLFGCIPFFAAFGQDDLSMSNGDTVVRDVSFRFLDTSTFETDRLLQEMATKGPGYFDGIKNHLAFLPLISKKTFPFDPVELQRDVIRLRRFYERNGFPSAKVDYPTSQYRLSDNSIRVIITITEGEPTKINSLSLVLEAPIYDGLLDRWTALTKTVQAKAGERYTELLRFQIENQVVSLLQDRGYAFAKVASDVHPQADNSVVDIDLRVDPGPLTTVDTIEVVGIQNVSKHLLLRELPFKSGQRYSRKKFIQGQQELFGLGLFRLALAEIPEQLADSTVDLRYIVRESKPRFVSAETGFSWETGLSVESNLRHRNLFGGARQMTGALGVNTGWLASPSNDRSPVKSVSASISLRQPFLFTTRLSGSTAPFYSWQDDPNQDTRYYKVGVTNSLLYELLPFRTLAVQHTFGRTVPLIGTDFQKRFDIYDLSLLSIGATIGKVNNFLNPRRGILVRPQLETGGLIGGSGVEFLKGRLDVALYFPITKRSSGSLSLMIGKMTPQGGSRDQVIAENEFRFDAIRFYAGGSTDVRGWTLNALGPQIALADSVATNADGSFSVSNAHYEAIGGQAKASGRLEIRLPIPGLSNSWSWGVFLDGGVLSSEITLDENGRPVLTAEGLPQFSDEGRLSFKSMKYGTGTGLRYQTPVGLMRFDLAYKVNPSREDLRSAKDVFLFQSGFTDEPGRERFIRRFNFQVSIERTF